MSGCFGSMPSPVSEVFLVLQISRIASESVSVIKQSEGQLHPHPRDHFWLSNPDTNSSWITSTGLSTVGEIRGTMASVSTLPSGKLIAAHEPLMAVYLDVSHSRCLV